MNKLTPFIKGIITAVFLLSVTLVFFYSKLPPDSGLQYLVYVVYAAGILWALISYSQSTGSVKFGELFSQGFRCFIVTTLIMVMFTTIFSLSHPEFAEKDSSLYKDYLVEKKEYTPSEIDEMVTRNKKQYTTKLIYSAIFGYLILGSLFTAAGAGLITVIRKKE